MWGKIVPWVLSVAVALATVIPLTASAEPVRWDIASDPAKVIAEIEKMNLPDMPDEVATILRGTNGEKGDFKFLVKKASSTGSNWCQYTSKVSVHYACITLDGNPFGYYHVQTYRQGDTITWNHFSWWADYKGRGISCPLNEEWWSPYKWVVCGFPPD